MRIGVDLGGTKIEAVALDDGGALLARKRVPTPADSYPAIVAATARLVRSIERRVGATGSVGVGCPGALSGKTGLIKNANTVVLNGKPLDRDLSAALGRPVRLENDANCFALSEAIDGAGSHSKVVFGVILGTGVGGGIVVDKALVRGRNRIAGEWGHNPLPWAAAEERPGPLCYCGKSGCIETFLSGPGLENDYDRATGTRRNARDITGAAGAGEAAARDCLSRYRDRLARSLAVVINIFDPDVIVVGGGLSNVDGLYRDLRTAIEGYGFSDAIETQILQARHGDSSGVRGAARLWPGDRRG